MAAIAATKEPGLTQPTIVTKTQWFAPQSSIDTTVLMKNLREERFSLIDLQALDELLCSRVQVVANYVANERAFELARLNGTETYPHVEKVKEKLLCVEGKPLQDRVASIQRSLQAWAEEDFFMPACDPHEKVSFASYEPEACKTYRLATRLLGTIRTLNDELRHFTFRDEKNQEIPLNRALGLPNVEEALFRKFPCLHTSLQSL